MYSYRLTIVYRTIHVHSHLAQVLVLSCAVIHVTRHLYKHNLWYKYNIMHVHCVKVLIYRWQDQHWPSDTAVRGADSTVGRTGKSCQHPALCPSGSEWNTHGHVHVHSHSLYMWEYTPYTWRETKISMHYSCSSYTLPLFHSAIYLMFRLQIILRIQRIVLWRW